MLDNRRRWCRCRLSLRILRGNIGNIEMLMLLGLLLAVLVWRSIVQKVGVLIEMMMRHFWVTLGDNSAQLVNWERFRR